MEHSLGEITKEKIQLAKSLEIVTHKLSETSRELTQSKQDKSQLFMQLNNLKNDAIAKDVSFTYKVAIKLLVCFFFKDQRARERLVRNNS